MIKKFKIPNYVFEAVDKFPNVIAVRPKITEDSIRYLNCDPEHIEFIKGENKWAKSVGEPELSYFVSMSLTSAHVFGFNNIDKYDAQKSKVVDYDLDQRWVKIKLVEN